MKASILILILASTLLCFGQEHLDSCTRKKMTISQIKKQFPYNRAKTIALVSFKHEYYVASESDTTTKPPPDNDPEIPKTNGIVDLSKMFEVKTLDNRLAEKIMNILMNYTNDGNRTIAFCYEPRNGIVFLDDKKNVLGYIEICFECLQYKVEPDQLTLSGFCMEKFNALAGLFTEAGITYGPEVR